MDKPKHTSKTKRQRHLKRAFLCSRKIPSLQLTVAIHSLFVDPLAS